MEVKNGKKSLSYICEYLELITTWEFIAGQVSLQLLCMLPFAKVLSVNALFFKNALKCRKYMRYINVATKLYDYRTKTSQIVHGLNLTIICQCFFLLVFRSQSRLSSRKQ